MARGKNAALAAQRSDRRVAEAEDERRNAIIRANRAERIIEQRDAEIASLKEALTQARNDHTKVGTYTEADMAAARAEARQEHRDKVRAGFEFMDAKGVPLIPLDDMSGLIEAFDCEMVDILGAHATHRAHKRLSRATVRLFDEGRRQGVV
jgi:multidrug efflux pump subunit AcrA (membrane-fusion protein)